MRLLKECGVSPLAKQWRTLITWNLSFLKPHQQRGLSPLPVPTRRKTSGFQKSHPVISRNLWEQNTQAHTQSFPVWLPSIATFYPSSTSRALIISTKDTVSKGFQDHQPRGDTTLQLCVAESASFSEKLSQPTPHPHYLSSLITYYM